MALGVLPFDCLSVCVSEAATHFAPASAPSSIVPCGTTTRPHARIRGIISTDAMATGAGCSECFDEWVCACGLCLSIKYPRVARRSRCPDMCICRRHSPLSVQMCVCSAARSCSGRGRMPLVQSRCVWYAFCERWFNVVQWMAKVRWGSTAEAYKCIETCFIINY